MLRRVSLVSTNILLCLFILQLTSSAIVDNAPNQEEVYEAINSAPANNERWVTKGPHEARISYSGQGSDVRLSANSRLAQFYNAQSSTKFPIRPDRTWVQPNLAGLQGILPMSPRTAPAAVRGLSRQQSKSRLEQLLSHDGVRGNSPDQGISRLQQWAQLSPEKIRGFTRQQRLNKFSPEATEHLPMQQEDEQEGQYSDAISLEEQLGQPMPRDKFSPYQQASQSQQFMLDQFHVEEPIDESQITTNPQQTYVDTQQADIQLPRPNADTLPPPAYEEPALNPATQRKPMFKLPKQLVPNRNPEPQQVAPNVDQGYQPFQLPASGWNSWHTQPARATLSYDDQSTYDYQQPNSYLTEYPATVQGDQGLLPISTPSFEQPASGLSYVTYDVTPQSPVADLPIDVYNRAVRAYLSTKTPITVSQYTGIPVAYSASDYQGAYAYAESCVAQYKAALGIS